MRRELLLLVLSDLLKVWLADPEGTWATASDRDAALDSAANAALDSAANAALDSAAAAPLTPAAGPVGALTSGAAAVTRSIPLSASSKLNGNTPINNQVKMLLPWYKLLPWAGLRGILVRITSSSGLSCPRERSDVTAVITRRHRGQEKSVAAFTDCHRQGLKLKVKAQVLHDYQWKLDWPTE